MVMEIYYCSNARDNFNLKLNSIEFRARKNRKQEDFGGVRHRAELGMPPNKRIFSFLLPLIIFLLVFVSLVLHFYSFYRFEY